MEIVQRLFTILDQMTHNVQQHQETAELESDIAKAIGTHRSEREPNPVVVALGERTAQHLHAINDANRGLSDSADVVMQDVVAELKAENPWLKHTFAGYDISYGFDGKQFAASVTIRASSAFGEMEIRCLDFDMFMRGIAAMKILFS